MNKKRINKRANQNKIVVPEKGKGSMQKKILLLLLAGVAFGLSRSPKQQIKILCSIPEELEKLGPNTPRAIRSLYNARLIRKVKNADGTTTLVLSEKGKKRALVHNIDTIKLKHKRVWDMKWRIVSYDVPEKYKNGRDALRRTLIRIGMYELQKSVFVFPHECRDEIDFIVELYNLHRYVRYVEAILIDNEVHIKKEFRVA